jgi:hypothetical protein
MSCIRNYNRKLLLFAREVRRHLVSVLHSRIDWPQYLGVSLYIPLNYTLAFVRDDLSAGLANWATFMGLGGWRM